MDNKYQWFYQIEKLQLLLLEQHKYFKVDDLLLLSELSFSGPHMVTNKFEIYTRFHHPFLSGLMTIYQLKQIVFKDSTPTLIPFSKLPYEFLYIHKNAEILDTRIKLKIKRT